MFTNLNKYTKHSYFMSLALQQAHRTLGNTGPNPAVGCVIIKDNYAISAGHTSINGRPHAEYNAINLSKINLQDSELYVTLEPCSHYGKTQPCVKTIIKKKIKRVFFSIKDPDSRSHNKSTKEFKKFKIKVKNGILDSYIKNFYKSYFKSKMNILPFVTAKMAVSKDFYTSSKQKRWITNKFSRGRVHLMRNNHDCILTSVKTIIIDNPTLTSAGEYIILNPNGGGVALLTTTRYVYSHLNYSLNVNFINTLFEKVNCKNQTLGDVFLQTKALSGTSINSNKFILCYYKIKY